MDWVLLGSEHTSGAEYHLTFFPRGWRARLGGWGEEPELLVLARRGRCLVIFVATQLCTHLEKMNTPSFGLVLPRSWSYPHLIIADILWSLAFSTASL